MSYKAKRLFAAALATISIAAVPTIQAISGGSAGIPLACQSAGGVCTG